MDPNSSEIVESKLRRAGNVLEGYKRFEEGLGMYKIDISKLMEMILSINTENNEVPKKDLQQTYNKVMSSGGGHLP